MTLDPIGHGDGSVACDQSSILIVQCEQQQFNPAYSLGQGCLNDSPATVVNQQADASFDPSTISALPNCNIQEYFAYNKANKSLADSQLAAQEASRHAFL